MNVKKITAILLSVSLSFSLFTPGTISAFAATAEEVDDYSVERTDNNEEKPAEEGGETDSGAGKESADTQAPPSDAESQNDKSDDSAPDADQTGINTSTGDDSQRETADEEDQSEDVVIEDASVGDTDEAKADDDQMQDDGQIPDQPLQGFLPG